MFVRMNHVTKLLLVRVSYSKSLLLNVKITSRRAFVSFNTIPEPNHTVRYKPRCGFRYGALQGQCDAWG
jgi:hypothetical protein